MRFTKYHALGNDYIVIDPKDAKQALSVQDITTICHRNFGVGSDGILYGPEQSDKGDFALRIFNPDGSEAEKSGNGLRIFSRYLWEQKLVSDEAFTIQTKGGMVKSIIADHGATVSVEMGKVRFTHASEGEPELASETIEIDDKTFEYYLANVGNPHCVILTNELSPTLSRQYGPLIESASRFANRTNVQFVKVIDSHTIQIEIWERGAGYTLASGSSSTAAASVVHALGLCKSNIDVHMPGGVINIKLTPDFFATMTGPVTKICDGELYYEKST